MTTVPLRVVTFLFTDVQDSRHGVCVPSVVLSFDLRFYRRVEARP